jgi:hypothetical protein
MTWEPDVENELIYDYEIGLSSTKDGLVPDLSNVFGKEEFTCIRKDT